MNPRSRRRLTVVVPAVAAILGVTAVQSGAAQACGRWLFGDGSPRAVDLTTNSAASLDRAPRIERRRPLTGRPPAAEKASSPAC